jgi:hypothetical protein
MFLFPYIDNGYPLIYPFLPRNCDKPPTLYSILESIVNYGKDDKTKIKDLAKVGRTKIFDFDYPLSDKISKEEFECMILNHYITRRIGFDTPTLFKIQLNVKLNEIMPIYNKMFDSIDGWDIFKDGEKTTRYGTDNREINSTSNTENTLHNKSNSENISDRRYSDTPQNELQNIRDGKYVTEYNYDTNNAEDTSDSNGTSQNTLNTNDDNTYNEIIEKTNANKIEILKQMQQEIKSIYSLIFNDLDDLFYSII